MKQPYIFRATCTRVIDGDTIDCDIDVGFGLKTHQRLRLHGIDTPELRSKELSEREAAQRAKSFVEEWVQGKELFVNTYKSDVFGRYLARVYDIDDCLNDILLEEGHAVPFMAERSLVD